MPKWTHRVYISGENLLIGNSVNEVLRMYFPEKPNYSGPFTTGTLALFRRRKYIHKNVNIY